MSSAMAFDDPAASAEIWPIDPEPSVTNLSGRQFWRFEGGIAREVRIGDHRLAASDGRIAFLGVRRDPENRAYPAGFSHCPRTGRPLSEPLLGTDTFGWPYAGPGARPDGRTLHLDKDGLREVPLSRGLPALFAAGRPSALYLHGETLGSLEWFDALAGRWASLGRLPPADLPPHAHALVAGPDGLAFAGRDALVTVPLPQIGTNLAAARHALPGLRFLSAPAWRAGCLVLPAARAGRLLLARLRLRGAEAEGPLTVTDLGPLDAPAPFAAPFANGVEDLLFVGASAVVIARADTDEAVRVPWPEGFAPILAQRPFRDGRDVHHQLGLAAGRYHYAALVPGMPLRALDGPHLSAGGVTYAGADRHAVPWEAPAESLTLGRYAGHLLVPLLGLARDTILMAVRPAEGAAAFLRGEPLRAPVLAHILHHAHGGGLHDLDLALAVSSLHDASAFPMGRALYLCSRAEGRCFGMPMSLR
ncbi:hypothetical protein [Methylobacterium sp. A54F]